MVLLSGGTGGAKLARGMLDVVGAAALTVVANTADDVEFYGAHVSPDPDLVAYWLADLIDERGWGLRGDTWKEMEALAAGGEEPWFKLGDRDMELCRLRAEALRRGERLTLAHAEVCRAIGLEARVLPMADEPIRTHVRTQGRWVPFQEFMVRLEAATPIEGVDLHGIEHARATPEVTAALGSADVIVIGPSNPVISIGPILAVPGMTEAILSARAPVVAVSPFVGGHAVRGPTDPFCRQAGIALGPGGIAQAYAAMIDALVSDEPLEGARVPVEVADTLMDSASARRRVAKTTLRVAELVST